MRMLRALHSILVFLVPTVALADLPATASVLVADGGQAKLPIVVGAKASAAVRQHARTLVDYLEKMSGAKFDVTEGDGKRGIAIGHADDFGLPSFGQEKDPAKRENYL